MVTVHGCFEEKHVCRYNPLFQELSNHQYIDYGLVLGTSGRIKVDANNSYAILHVVWRKRLNVQSIQYSLPMWP